MDLCAAGRTFSPAARAGYVGRLWLDFLGAAIYMLHGFLWPSWENACGQLIAFLTYDLVLIVPYFKLARGIQAEYRMSLAVYLTIIIYSGLLASYYLFIHPATRVRVGSGIAFRPFKLASPRARGTSLADE
ncbi:MAG: hypothetical protein U0Y68_14015 [Blastocatellia bacterium]